MSYLLALGEAVVFPTPIEPGGIMALHSASWDADSRKGSVFINLLNNSGDILLHISLRHGENAIVFNSKTANGNWGREERERLQGTFIMPSFNITICDHGEGYEILFSYQTIHYYSKRINGIISSASYHLSENPPTLSQTLVVATYDSMEDVVLTNQHATFSHGVGPTALPGRRKKDRLGFEYAEHAFLGDAILLKLAGGGTVVAKDHPFRLPNGLNVTYGEINGLAGDFYGTYDPISDGATEQQQCARFLDAFNTLAASGDRQPQEAIAILKVLQREVDAVNEALNSHENPSIAYSNLPDETPKLEKITFGRRGIPGYIGLAQINWDHFGNDARTAYNAGHGTAIDEAVRGNLDRAYTLNAFADHFLEDSFSAGHLRTPRRMLHSSKNPLADLCAKYMHDEDCAIGLSVQNPSNEQWTAYGDKRALDQANEDSKNRCIDAVQASADEIYTAWQTRIIPAPSDYRAWTYAPTLASAAGSQLLAPLFKLKNQRRATITNRRNWKFTGRWWYATTVFECWHSGWWKYPITIDGPQRLFTKSAVAATAVSPWVCRVFFQNVRGDIHESVYTRGEWTRSNSALFTAKPFTPLAAINWHGGKEVRIYCLSIDDLLQEWCWSSGNGWTPGYLSDLRVRTAPNTSIAAVHYDDNGPHIRVYCQESISDVVQEYCSGNPWTKGATFPTACTGSSLAAIGWMENGVHL